jgi:hypothetical protein
LAVGSEGEALGDEVVANEGKGPICQDGGAHVKQTGISSAETKGALGEAMLGDVLVGG